jgi:hypothetical protein
MDGFSWGGIVRGGGFWEVIEFGRKLRGYDVDIGRETQPTASVGDTT